MRYGASIDFKTKWRLVYIAALFITILSSGIACVASPPNVLFIAIDDLRPALGCYGDKVAVTPNLDAIATRGLLFERAYCQQAVCCPSRLSLLTGLRPDTIQVWDLATHFREMKPNAVTLPQHFKNHGYHTQSIGKIFHGSGKPSKDAPSWSVAPKFDLVRDPKLRYALPANLSGKGLKRSATESANVPDDYYVDGLVCNAAIDSLQSLGQKSTPFFLAVGFRKPHLPFCAPKKYWNLYDSNKIPLPKSVSFPADAPEWATRSWKELEGYSDIDKDAEISLRQLRRLRHGYYACVSYIDALVGRLTSTLHDLGLEQNTVIVVWGDHGFHLGEQGLWTKANNYELSTRVPLIIAAPNQASKGTTTRGMVEFVDVYPTLAELCGLDTPHRLDGFSFAPLFESPNQPWKLAAFSQYPRAKSGHRHKRHGHVMGYAVRTSRFRYVEWRHWEKKKVIATELYDHSVDPNETRNLAEHPKYQSFLVKLAATLQAGPQKSLPTDTR